MMAADRPSTTWAPGTTQQDKAASMNDPSRTSAFVLSCVSCADTVTIDTAQAQWPGLLHRMAADHADHLQSVLAVPEPHEAAS